MLWSEDSVILVGVDFSEHAHAAIDAAIELASRFHARVRLVHAHALPGFTFRGAAWMLSPGELSEIEARSAANLEQLTERLRGEHPGVRFEGVQVPAPAVKGLVAEAEQSKPKLLVVGTHGRGFWSRLTLGTVTRDLVHRAPVPLLTVHLDPTDPASVLSLAPATVLVPIDMDPESLHALDFAIDWAKDLDWKVRVLHAYPGYEGGPFGKELEVRAFREQAMKTILEERQHAGVELEAACVEGAAVETILTFAARRGEAARDRVGMVVMATHESGSLRRAFTSSVASEVVRIAPCPVLTLRAANSEHG